MLRHVHAGVLDVALEESGPADGTPVVLLHGFPYDAHAYDEVVPLLVGAGRRRDRAVLTWVRAKRFVV